MILSFIFVLPVTYNAANSNLVNKNVLIVFFPRPIPCELLNHEVFANFDKAKVIFIRTLV